MKRKRWMITMHFNRKLLAQHIIEAMFKFKTCDGERKGIWKNPQATHSQNHKIFIISYCVVRNKCWASEARENNNKSNHYPWTHVCNYKLNLKAVGFSHFPPPKAFFIPSLKTCALRTISFQCSLLYVQTLKGRKKTHQTKRWNVSLTLSFSTHVL